MALYAILFHVSRHCFVNRLRMNVGGVYISGVIGMCLYLFQAAEFIQIVKDEDYKESGKVEITRKIVQCKTGMNHFFYKKYDKCIGCAVDTQIV